MDDDDDDDSGDGALDQADVAYSANSFMAVVKPVSLCMTLSAFITVSLYSDAEGATNRWERTRVCLNGFALDRRCSRPAPKNVHSYSPPMKKT